MCGVAGVFSYHYAAPPVEREELRRIRDHMARRGPDGAGEWYAADGRVGLGHRRLAIIDVSERGAQPMVSADGGSVLCYNGEIYNYRELRARLEREGCEFRSQSDTEVLLHLYARRGEAMVHELRGMFAFALWDAKKGAMLLTRDPYGIKPLYYADDGWTLRIASQVKALLASPKVSRQPEPAGLVGFYLFGSVPEPYTLYQEIRSVPAGSVVWVDGSGAAAPKRYFSIAEVYRRAVSDTARPDDAERRELITTALRDTVRAHLVADVPVGAFLSAGVDSAAIVALAAESGATGMQTVTLGFDEFEGRAEDETALAARTAAHYGVRHSIRRVTSDEFAHDLPAILTAMDQPSIDGINAWFVAKAAAERGLKVALSGVGGDELFGGYPSFHDIPRWVRMCAIPSRIPLLGDLIRAFASSPITSDSPLSPKAFGLIKYGGSYPGAYFLRRGLFMPWELEALMDSETAREGLHRLAPVQYIDSHLHPDPGDAFARVATLESSLYLRNQLLRDTDWASMDHSLEVRTPLVDAELLRSVAPLMVGRNGKEGKAALATSPNTPLPEVLLHRPKTGFTVPWAEWVQSVRTLDAWRGLPLLQLGNCHWSRRLAYAVQRLAFA